MRRLADQDRIHRFIHALAGRATRQARLYFTGGATAVLLGWRGSTIDVDILLVPDDDRLLRALPELKENRFPAIDPRAFRQAVEKVVEAFESS